LSTGFLKAERVLISINCAGWRKIFLKTYTNTIVNIIAKIPTEGGAHPFFMYADAMVLLYNHLKTLLVATNHMCSPQHTVVV
jgi:hypothetical protein